MKKARKTTHATRGHTECDKEVGGHHQIFERWREVFGRWREKGPRDNIHTCNTRGQRQKLKIKDAANGQIVDKTIEVVDKKLK